MKQFNMREVTLDLEMRQKSQRKIAEDEGIPKCNEEGHDDEDKVTGI